MLRKLVLFPFQQAINRILRLDPQTYDALSELSGKVLALKLQTLPFPMTVYVLFTVDGIQLHADEQVMVDVSIQGTPIALINLWLQRNELLADNDIHITGDVHLLQSIQQIAARMDIDWEEKLAHVFGDTIAHQLGEGSRHARRWVKDTMDSSAQNLSEYLQQEHDLLPGRLAVNDFLTDIDNLRASVDRLEVRMRRLDTQIQGETA